MKMADSEVDTVDQEQQYLDLCTRIRDHCARQGWYGPDGDEHDKGRLSAVQYPYDPSAGFGFPPATEYQLYLTEEALGYPLPPVLRFLLSNVANGGFGPSAGITGAYEGYCPRYDGRYSTLEGYATQAIDELDAEEAGKPMHYISLANLTALRPRGANDEIELLPGTWPKRLLHLTYDGCNEDTYLDAETGRIYSVGYGREVAPQQWSTTLIPVAESLEQWLEAWLRGTLSDLYHRSPPEVEWDADGPIYWADFRDVAADE